MTRAVQAIADTASAMLREAGGHEGREVRSVVQSKEWVHMDASSQQF